MEMAEETGEPVKYTLDTLESITPRGGNKHSWGRLCSIGFSSVEIHSHVLASFLHTHFACSYFIHFFSSRRHLCPENRDVRQWDLSCAFMPLLCCLSILYTNLYTHTYTCIYIKHSVIFICFFFFFASTTCVMVQMAGALCRLMT